MEHAQLNTKIPVTSLTFENFYFDYHYTYRFRLGLRLGFGLGLGLGLRLGLRVSFSGFISMSTRMEHLPSLLLL